MKSFCHISFGTGYAGLGVLGLIVWYFPIIGLPVSITGLVFSVNALRRPVKGLAIAGTILCGLGVGLSAFHAAFVSYYFGYVIASSDAPSEIATSNIRPSQVGLQKDELPLASATIFGSWEEEDFWVNDPLSWSGSAGVIGEVEGYLLLITNKHCLGLTELFAADFDDKPEIKKYDIMVEFASGVEVPVLGFQIPKDEIDLAILFVDASKVKEGKDYVKLPIDESVVFEQGSEVVAVGSPSGLTGTQTFGRISAIRNESAGSLNYRLIQTDAAINHGNSGGPLFLRRQDGSYAFIGVNTARMDNADNLGFAIDVAILSSKQFSEDMIFCAANADALTKAINQ